MFQLRERLKYARRMFRDSPVEAASRRKIYSKFALGFTEIQKGLSERKGKNERS